MCCHDVSTSNHLSQPSNQYPALCSESMMSLLPTLSPRINLF